MPIRELQGSSMAVPSQPVSCGFCFLGTTELDSVFRRHFVVAWAARQVEDVGICIPSDSAGTSADVGGDSCRSLLRLGCCEYLLRCIPRYSVPSSIRPHHHNSLGKLRVAECDEDRSVIAHVLSAFLIAPTDHPGIVHDPCSCQLQVELPGNPDIVVQVGVEPIACGKRRCPLCD